MWKILSRLAIPAALAAVTLLTPSTTRAEEYEYCAYLGALGGSTNCGFHTFQDCMKAVSGNSGSCQENPRFTAPEKKTAPTKRKPKAE
jgi:hypothetical protein